MQLKSDEDLILAHSSPLQSIHILFLYFHLLTHLLNIAVNSYIFSILNPSYLGITAMPIVFLSPPENVLHLAMFWNNTVSFASWGGELFLNQGIAVNTELYISVTWFMLFKLSKEISLLVLWFFLSLWNRLYNGHMVFCRDIGIWYCCSTCSPSCSILLPHSFYIIW